MTLTDYHVFELFGVCICNIVKHLTDAFILKCSRFESAAAALAGLLFL